MANSSLLLANPKIHPNAVLPITKKGYPKFYAQWGPEGIKRINTLMPRAAEKVAASPECDRVELVELSGQRSVPKSKIVFFVDCANRKRFYVEETDLNSAGGVRSQTAKMVALGDGEAILACERGVKAKLSHPLTFDRKLFSTSVHRAPTTGNVAVQFDFEAKNSLGAELPHRARCIFTDRGLESVDIDRS